MLGQRRLERVVLVIDPVDLLVRRDLRRLRARYGDKMRDVAVSTMTEGRPTKGMPTWGDVLNAEAIGKILTFLESVQN